MVYRSSTVHTRTHIYEREERESTCTWRIRGKKKKKTKEDRVRSLIISGWWWCWDTRQLDAVSFCPMALSLSFFTLRPSSWWKGFEFSLCLRLSSFLFLSLQQGFRVWWSLSLCEPFIPPRLSLSLSLLPSFLLARILAYLYHARWVPSLSLRFPSILFALLHTGCAQQSLSCVWINDNWLLPLLRCYRGWELLPTVPPSRNNLKRAPHTEKS